jgi:YfiH family protein
VKLHCIEPQWPAPSNVLAFSTTRQGGHSAPPYQSFNLGHHVDDNEEAVALNQQLLLEKFPSHSSLQWLTQVHGVDVIEAGIVAEDEIGTSYPQADACWSRKAGDVCAILTADCLPVLLCGTAGNAVAAAHAGWRGLAQGVLEATVSGMGVDSSEILAWLGPAIGPGAFEVGTEVRDCFVDSTVTDSASVHSCFLPNPARGGYFYADLYALARLRLEAVGVTAIYGGEHCTYSDAEHFYSYRRDGQTGRMASLIGLTS